MKLSRKKLLAREFLILLSCVFAFALALLGTYPYNGVIESRINGLQKEIKPLQNKADSLAKKFSGKEEKQKWFYKENIDRYGSDVVGYSTHSELWNRLEELHKTDSIIYKWDNVWSKELIKFIEEKGFKNGREFIQFISDYSFSSNDVQDKLKADSITNEIETIESLIRTEKYKIMDSDDMMGFSLICLVIAGILAFPLRYLFYSIKWSIKTLRQKE